MKNMVLKVEQSYYIKFGTKLRRPLKWREKIVKKQVSEFNTSSMSKPRKILYNKIIKNYRFCEIYDFFKVYLYKWS